MKFHTATARLVAMVLAFVMVMSMAAVPANAASAEIRFSQDGIEINGKIVASSDALALLASLGQNGEVMADVNLYANENGLAVTANPFLAQAYGIGFANLAENFKNSVFAPDSGSALAIDQSIVDSFMAGYNTATTQMTGAMNNVDMAVVEQAVSAVEKYVGIVAEALTSGSDIKAEAAVLPIGANEYEATVINVSIGTETVANLAEALLTTAAGDAELEKVAIQIADMALQSAANIPDAPAMPKGSQLITEVWDALRQIAPQIAPAITEAGCDTVISVATDNATGALLCVSVTMTIQGDTAVFSVTTVPDYLSFTMCTDEGTVVAGISFVTNENSANLYSAEFTVTEYDREMAKISFTWDKITSVYRLTLAQRYDESTMSGTLTVNSDSIVLTVDMIDGQMIDLAVILSAGEDTVEVPEYQEILTMSEDEIVELVNTVMSVAQSIVG